MPMSLGPGHAAMLKPLQPSAYWGEEQIWDTRVNNHNSMVDAKGRVWLDATTGGPENPAYCLPGAGLPSAECFPMTEPVVRAAAGGPRSAQAGTRHSWCGAQ